MLMRFAAGSTWAGVFTRHEVGSAPVDWCMAARSATGGSSVRAVVVNAGCANSFTGAPGAAAVETVTHAMADALDCAPDEVLVAALHQRLDRGQCRRVADAVAGPARRAERQDPHAGPGAELVDGDGSLVAGGDLGLEHLARCDGHPIAGMADEGLRPAWHVAPVDHDHRDGDDVRVERCGDGGVLAVHDLEAAIGQRHNRRLELQPVPAFDDLPDEPQRLRGEVALVGLVDQQIGRGQAIEYRLGTAGERRRHDIGQGKGRDGTHQAALLVRGEGAGGGCSQGAIAIALAVFRSAAAWARRNPRSAEVSRRAAISVRTRSTSSARFDRPITARLP